MDFPPIFPPAKMSRRHVRFYVMPHRVGGSVRCPHTPARNAFTHPRLSLTPEPATTAVHCSLYVAHYHICVGIFLCSWLVVCCCCCCCWLFRIARVETRRMARRLACAATPATPAGVSIWHASSLNTLCESCSSSCSRSSARQSAICARVRSVSRVKLSFFRRRFFGVSGGKGGGGQGGDV